MAKRIGDVARAAGVGVETVRFYEREGLLDQPPKPVQGWREYDQKALRQLEQVRLAQAMGLTLKDMKRLRNHAQGPRPQFCAGTRETVVTRMAAIEAEIAALQAKHVALKRWLSLCKRRRDDADCPLYAQINALMNPPAKPSRKRS
jgi:MerR family mercuric resistance operon transcriptional regulator